MTGQTAGERTRPTHPCARCGVPRQINSGRPATGLCADCGYVLTKEEKQLWAA